MLETTERSRIVSAARRDIGAELEWRIADRLTLQGALVNGEGPNRAANPDNRMAYIARATVTPVKGLDVGGAFAGYSDSAEVDAQAMYRTTRGVARVSTSGTATAGRTFTRSAGTPSRGTAWFPSWWSCWAVSSNTTRAIRSRPTARPATSSDCSTSSAATTSR